MAIKPSKGHLGYMDSTSYDFFNPKSIHFWPKLIILNNYLQINEMIRFVKC